MNNNNKKQIDNKTVQFKRLTAIRIYLTENCNSTCKNCFNKKIRKSKHMDFNKLVSLYKFLKKHSVPCLLMMGGEPTIHPKFLELYKIAQKYFFRVTLFTNAINTRILNIIPRTNDAIIYNFLFINESFDLNKLLPSVPNFIRGFEIAISSDSDIKKIIKNIDYIYKKYKTFSLNDKYLKFQLTPNCVEDIFKKRKELNTKFLYVISFINEMLRSSLSFDHSFPFCFWLPNSINKLQDMKLEHVYKHTCRESCPGLIDSNFYLLHDNQYPKKIFNIFNEKNEIVDFDLIVNSLIKATLEKRIINFNKGCDKCMYFHYICTGGCFMHKDFIQQKLIK